MLTHAREVLLLLFCCCCQLLFLSATQAASDDLKQQMKQIDKPKKPHGRVPKEAKKTKAREPEAEVSEKDEPEESIPSPTGAPYMESVSEPEQEDEDNDVFQGPFKLPAEKEGLDAVLAKLPPKIKGVADGFERAVLESLPGDLSQCPGCLCFLSRCELSCVCAGPEPILDTTLSLNSI